MLEERIRTHIEDIAPPVSIDAVRQLVADGAPLGEAGSTGEIAWSFESERPEGSPWRPWLLAAAAAVVAFLGGVALFGLRQDSEVVATDPEDSISAAAGPVRDLPELPGDLAEVSWRDVTGGFPPVVGEQTFQFLDAVSSDGVVWVVGQTVSTRVGSSEFEPEPTILRSEDGIDWVKVDLGLLAEEGDGITNISSFQQVVVSDDGAVWVFGNSFSIADNGTGSTTAPLAYRTTDGENWSALDLPINEGVPTAFGSADAEGDGVLVVLGEADFFATGGIEDSWTTLTTPDGIDWSVVSESSNLVLSIFENGAVRDVSEADLAADTSRLSLLERGPGLSVAVGIDDGFGGSDVIAEEDVFSTDQEVQVWLSVGGETWGPLERPEPQRPTEFPSGLFAHSEGVLAAVHWSDGEQGGVDLWNIDASGTVTNLGQLPVSWLQTMFVHDEQLFVVGLEATSSVDEEPSPDPRVWVAEFEAAEDEPTEEAAPEAAGRQGDVEEELIDDEQSVESEWPDQDDRAATTPTGVNRAGGRGVGLTVSGELVMIDIVSGRTGLRRQLPNEAVFYQDMELNWDGTVVYVHELVEDSWFSCETEGGSIRRFELDTDASELIGRGSEPTISPDGTRLAYLGSTDCIPDTSIPGGGFLAVRDTIIVRDLATGVEASWIDEEIVNAIATLDVEALAEQSVGLSGLTWLDDERLASGYRRIDVSTMIAAADGADVNIVPFVDVIGTSSTTQEVVVNDGLLKLVDPVAGDVRVFGAVQTAAYDATGENLAVLVGSSLFVDRREVQLTTELDLFDW